MDFEEAAAAADTAETATETAEVTPDLAPSQEVSEAPAPDPTGQFHTVKVNGEEVQVSLDEALSGYMRTADYTQKTQALAAQREDLEVVDRIAQALEADPEGTIAALATAYGIENFGPQQAAAPEAPAEPVDPEEARIIALEAKFADQEMRAFELQVKEDLSSLRQQYDWKFTDEDVLQYAVENGIPNITVAAKAFVTDRLYTQAQRQQSERQAQERKSTAPPVAGGHGVAGGSTQSGGVVAPTTIADAMALAEQAHGVSFTDF